MDPQHANYRKVLASFLEEIPKNKGWWYRLPLASISSKDDEPIATDAILPHLGNVFGLSEQAMLLFLVEMGCYQARGEGYIISKTGWEAFEAEFKVKSYIEVSRTSFDKQRSFNLIRLGFPEYKPSVIWRMYKRGKIKCPPRAISSHASAKFARKEFINVFQGSKLYMDVLKHHVGSYLKVNGIEASVLKEKNRRTTSWRDDDEEDRETTDGNQQHGQQVLQQEQNDEEERAAEGDLQMTTAAELEVDLTEGTLADPKEFPVMNIFKIPGDNIRALAQVHKEVTRRMQQLQTESGAELVCKGSILYDDGKDVKLFVEIPKGNSKSTFIKLRNIVVRIIKYCADNDAESLQGCSTKVIIGLESSFKEAFLDVAKLKGYSTSQAGVMGAEYWTAMAEAANLRTTQQTIISRFLFHHFGHRVVVPQRQLAAYGSTYVEYETFTEIFNGKQVLYSFRDISKLFEFYLPEMLESFKKEIDKLELTLGGDHGKGAFTFLACLIIRFTDGSDPQVMEFQIGEIDSEKDSMELLLPLVKKLEVGLLSMNPKGDGDCNFVVHRNADGVLKLHFEEAEVPVGAQVLLETTVELHINGDYKYLFMMAGRSGYCGDYCLYCQLKQSEWKRLHKQKECCDVGAAPWTVDALICRVVEQEQAAGLGKPLPSVGVRENPVWTFISVRRYLFPILHELLGLGNDLMSNFWKYVEEGAEPLEPDEIEARNMSLLAEIQLENSKLEVDECKLDLEAFVVERTLLNEYLNETIITALEKQEYKNAKDDLNKMEKDSRRKRDEFQAKAKELKMLFDAAKAKEGEIRKKRGRAEKTLANSIESEVLKQHKVHLSCFHGGDLVGEPIRILMREGRKIFEDIEEHIVETADKLQQRRLLEMPDSEEHSGSESDDSAMPDLDRAKKAGLEKIDKEELKAVCLAHGQMFQLLDGIFSLLNTKRGAVTAEIVETLKKRLELARKKWDDMGLSMTPKWHMLLAHAIELLMRTGGGLIEMGEDRIERAHQLRERDRQRYSRLRSIKKMKASQAKFQNLRMDPTIKSVQADVERKAKRNLKRGRSLKEENDDAKRVARNEERAMVVDEVAAQDRIALPKARKGKSMKLRGYLKR
jgi:hypothetical protein